MINKWLRIRLLMNPPTTEAEVERWWRHRRNLPSQVIDTSSPGTIQLFSDDDRLQLVRFADAWWYVTLQQNGWQLPPLQGPPYQLALLHEGDLFSIFQRARAFDHPYWRAVAARTSEREL